MDANGLAEGQKGWHLFLQQRFETDQKVTVVSVMGQLAKLQFKEESCITISFEELLNRLLHAGEALSEPLFNAMILNGLPERFQHFVVQENFNPAASFSELRIRLINYEKTRAGREGTDASSAAMATRRQARPAAKD